MNRALAVVIGVLGGTGCVLAIVAMILFALSSGTSDVMTALPMLTLGVFGALILLKQPNNLIGRLLFGCGLLLSVAAIGDAYAIYSAYENKLPYETWGWWIAHWAFTAGFVSVILGVLLLFPTGRLLSPRWRPVGTFIVITFAVFIFGTAFEPGLIGPDNIPPTENPASIALLDDIAPYTAPVILVCVFVSLVASAAMAILRVKRARGIERQQLKWPALIMVMTVTLHVSAEILRENRNGLSPLAEALSGVAYLLLAVGLPAVIALAVLRHDLYDIDRLINRTIVYLMMTTTLVLIYLALIFTVGGMVQGISGQSSSLVTAASTLTVAGLFRPIRSRFQRIVDRRFYRHKYDVQQSLDQFSHRLRDQVDLETLTTEIQSVIHETMQPAHVSLWLRFPQETRAGGTT